jgi:hypothetical protein
MNQKSGLGQIFYCTKAHKRWRTKNLESNKLVVELYITSLFPLTLNKFGLIFYHPLSAFETCVIHVVIRNEDKFGKVKRLVSNYFC